MDSVAVLSFSSRALTHVLTECLSDLIPNFAFRSDLGVLQRPLATDFTPAPARDAPPRMAGPHLAFGTRHLNAEFAMHAARAAGVFGAAHAEASLPSLLEPLMPPSAGPGAPAASGLRLVGARQQSFSPTFARWLVCLQRDVPRPGEREGFDA